MEWVNHVSVERISVSDKQQLDLLRQVASHKEWIVYVSIGEGFKRDWGSVMLVMITPFLVDFHCTQNFVALDAFNPYPQA